MIFLLCGNVLSFLLQKKKADTPTIQLHLVDMAASSAPFGTDLQSPTMAKIVAGKVLYVSKASTAIQLSAVSPSRREELVETVNAPSTKTVMSPVATSSILHLNISDHTFSRIISDCRLHSKSLKYIEKLRLFEILINNEVRVSTEQLSMLIDASGSSIDYYHVDYMEFLSTLKNMTNRFEKPNKPVANQEEMRETLSPLRLSKTCPPNFFTPRENFSPLNFKSRSSNHHTRPSTELDRSKTFKHGCNNNDSRAGVKNLISALRKCSNIRGNDIII